MTPNDSKSYLSYLNKLVNQYSNIHHHFIKKKPNNANYFPLDWKNLDQS